jgi:hypothetical protein
MTAIGAFGTVMEARAKALRALPPRSEKPSNSAQMDGERGRDEGTAARNSSRAVFAHLSQTGTTEAAPSWHAQRLNAAFVAQVLGQVMNTQACGQISAPAAYGRGRGIARLGFDARA